MVSYFESHNGTRRGDHTVVLLAFRASEQILPALVRTQVSEDAVLCSPAAGWR